jgi:hypothetical protein
VSRVGEADSSMAKQLLDKTEERDQMTIIAALRLNVSEVQRRFLSVARQFPAKGPGSRSSTNDRVVEKP